MFKQIAIFAATAATLVFAAPVSAGVLLPNLFAKSYCEMRDSGSDNDGALRWAVSESWVEGEPIRVRVNGRMTDADVIAANRAAMELCPQYF